MNEMPPFTTEEQHTMFSWLEQLALMMEAEADKLKIKARFCRQLATDIRSGKPCSKR